jgi:uncharacterized protein with GYD domain
MAIGITRLNARPALFVPTLWPQAAYDGLTKEVVTMAKFAVIGGYTAEAWSKMIDNPGDRTAAVSKALAALGGKLESFYWSFGDDDFLGIIEAPDDSAAAAFSVAVGSTGTLRNLRTIKLISLEDGRKVLEKAKTTKAAYSPPGAKTPAGVR